MTDAPKSHAKAEDEKADEVSYFVGDTPEAIVAHARAVLKEEAKHIEGTDGPADNFLGDQAPGDLKAHRTNDPYKAAFPPGPADPSKL